MNPIFRLRDAPPSGGFFSAAALAGARRAAGVAAGFTGARGRALLLPSRWMRAATSRKPRSSAATSWYCWSASPLRPSVSSTLPSSKASAPGAAAVVEHDLEFGDGLLQETHFLVGDAEIVVRLGVLAPDRLGHLVAELAQHLVRRHLEAVQHVSVERRVLDQLRGVDLGRRLCRELRGQIVMLGRTGHRGRRCRTARRGGGPERAERLLSCAADAAQPGERALVLGLTHQDGLEDGAGFLGEA